MLKSALGLARFSFVETGNMFLQKSPLMGLTNLRNIHVSSVSFKRIRIEGERTSVPRITSDLRVEGEHTVEISSIKQNQFPDEKTPNKLFDGVEYCRLPIVNIKSTRNNTIISTTHHTGYGIVLHSAGIEGFKNARKGTNIAAQQAAITHGMRTLEKGIKTVRVRVQGIGPGRMSAIKGLQVAGLNIVSITDDTRVSWNPPRPRKQRRI